MLGNGASRTLRLWSNTYKTTRRVFCSYIDFFAGRSGLIISYNWFSNVALCGSGVVQNREERLFTLYCRIAFYVFSWRIFCVLCSNSLSFDFFLGFQQTGSVLDGEDVDNAAAGIAFQGSAQEYLSLTIKFIVAFGMCFQLPVLLTLMGKAGLVSAEGLGNVRKYAVVAILVLAALVTPPDVITQVILFVVVYGLYEVSIFLFRVLRRNGSRSFVKRVSTMTKMILMILC